MSKLKLEEIKAPFFFYQNGRVINGNQVSGGSDYTICGTLTNELGSVREAPLQIVNKLHEARDYTSLLNTGLLTPSEFVALTKLDFAA